MITFPRQTPQGRAVLLTPEVVPSSGPRPLRNTGRISTTRVLSYNYVPSLGIFILDLSACGSLTQVPQWRPPLWRGGDMGKTLSSHGLSTHYLPMLHPSCLSAKCIKQAKIFRPFMVYFKNVLPEPHVLTVSL